MRANRLRILLISLIAAAAVISFVGRKQDSRVLDGIGFGVFLVAVGVYAYWRRAVRNEWAARVFDREAKTDEAGTRTDQ